MFQKSYHDVWLEKYGKEEADRLLLERAIRSSESMKLMWVEKKKGGWIGKPKEKFECPNCLRLIGGQGNLNTHLKKCLREGESI